MTANRPRRTTAGDEASFIEVLFGGASSTGLMTGGPHRVWRPPTDVYETDTEYVVQMEIAGAEHTDFYLSLDERHLTISGVRFDSNPEHRAYHRMEVHFGEFCSEVDLPGPVDKDGVRAEYHDGFLRIVLPRTISQYVNIR